ncbi:hypothetical protein J1C81_02975 [Streptococcus sanguinis]|jgi:hypothetical protein|uniref:Uncharacterized protein n=1 Tax=Streptococcus sanguinis SK330 TaxID=888813 RepID=F2C4K2_STRSA|nr:hypothetical protein [Streptococcus sanguinis]EGF15847.1 hypothetical protein HMPREF9386_0017 [Streptococcus sanguinis SK330]
MISCFMNGHVIKTSCKKTLRDCSKDDHGNALSNIVDDVVDFDNVKKFYCDKHLNASYTILKSVDTYLEGNNNQIFLIEFKNAKIDQKQKHGLNLKLKDSLLILTDSFGFNLKDFQKRLNYIVVYSEEKNDVSSQYLEFATENDIPASFKNRNLKKKISKRTTKQFFTFWGLSKYEHSLVNEVYTLNEHEFLDYYNLKINHVKRNVSSYSFS